MNLKPNYSGNDNDHLDFASHTSHEPMFVIDPVRTRKTDAHYMTKAAGFTKDCAEPALNDLDKNTSFISEYEIR